MQFKRCGDSGLKLPRLSLGCWNNFGDAADRDTMRSILRAAFDSGITHFDFGNNYGPPPGAAEANVGKILRSEFAGYRDELIISTKAGFPMWPGPYGDGGSRKYLMASLDQSLRRLQLDYVDIFYSHRFDPETPLEETVTALADAVRQGKALYAAISNYNGEQARRAAAMLEEQNVRLLLDQVPYSLLRRAHEEETFPVVSELGMGVVAFGPLSQGMLTDRYFDGIPASSRAGNPAGTLQQDRVSDQVVSTAKQLSEVAARRGQTLAQMALAWVLNHGAVTTALMGASTPEQVHHNVETLSHMDFESEELANIQEILAG
ncbi:MAG: aldo/keto reductase [Spirochaetaceae bacterium]|nr:aldo/keto reductase [Spirochaetaceae bacterium]